MHAPECKSTEHWNEINIHRRIVVRAGGRTMHTTNTFYALNHSKRKRCSELNGNTFLKSMFIDLLEYPWQVLYSYTARALNTSCTSQIILIYSILNHHH